METVNVKILHDESRNIGEQLIGLSFAIAAAIIVVYVQRKVSDPDFFLTMKMRTLNGISRYADTKARFWNDVSAKASALYLESRP